MKSKLLIITIGWALIFSVARSFEFSWVDNGHIVIYSWVMLLGYVGLLALLILSVIYWIKNRKKTGRHYLPLLLVVACVILAFAFYPTSSLHAYDNTGGFISEMHLPDRTVGKVPGIICFGGSEGGIMGGNEFAERLSRRGYAALGVAYFGLDGLPKGLEKIPLEYFENAFKQLKSNPMVDSNKIGVIGGSRGGELALLLASKYPKVIKAVISIAPGCYVFQSYTRGDWSRVNSSWTWHGQEVPFLPYKYDEKFDKSHRMLDYFNATLSQTEYLDKATIEVEKINGPVLLISGNDDQLWPSNYMAEKVVQRLKDNRFKFEYKHLDYKDAGHSFFSSELGGTPEGNRLADIDSWNQIDAFLGRAFK